MSGGEVLEVLVTDCLEQIDIERLCRKYAVDRAIASVVGATPDFERLLPKPLFERFHLLSYRSKLPIKIDYETPHTLGMDRVAAVVGARELCGGGPLVVVDAGSCITFDFVTADGEYLGDNISPGLHARLRAIDDYFPRLPRVEAEGDTPDLGYDTQTAIRSGVILGLKHEIEGYITYF